MEGITEFTSTTMPYPARGVDSVGCEEAVSAGFTSIVISIELNTVLALPRSVAMALNTKEPAAPPVNVIVLLPLAVDTTTLLPMGADPVTL